MNETLCGEHAAFRYTWPGRDESYCCIEHGSQLQRVADAIGCYVQMIPLSVRISDPIPDPWPTCKQHERGETDVAYLVRSIYRAMEHERRDSTSFAKRLGNQGPEIDQH